MSDFKISVILPVYNVENSLHVCINSVLRQSYQDFEIICVDDASTDSSLEILEYFARKDSRIRIFRNKTNKGVDFCKKRGLKIAKGNYIYFFENVGWLDLDAFEILTNAVKNNDVELVLFKSIFYNHKSKDFQIHPDYNVNFMDEFDLKVFDYYDLDKVMQFVISNVPLNKFFLKSCLDDKHDNELFSSAKKILFLNRNLCNIIGDDKNFSSKLPSIFNNLIYELFPSIQNIDDSMKIIEIDSSLIFNWINAIEEVLTKKKLMNYFKTVFLEFKLSNIHNWFYQSNNDDNEEFYNDMRQEFFNMRLKTSDFENIDFNLHRFYIRVLNYEFKKFKKFSMELKGNYDYIIKRDFNNKIENFDEIGINEEKRKESIIVSLTSFPERLFDIHFCLYSLLNQTFKPDKLILCLARDDFPNGEKDIPQNVLNFKKNGLSIKWCDDFKSYTKLIPVLKDYPDDFIVTVDDDVYYPEDLLETLWETYNEYPNTIVASRTRGIKLSSKNQFESYNSWKLQDEFRKPSFLNFFTGVGGVLYFPNALSNRVFDDEVFKNLCPNGDDIWFWAMAIINNTKITGNIKPYIGLKYINISRELGLDNNRTLWDFNQQGQNDIQFKRVLDYFPEILKIINNDIV